MPAPVVEPEPQSTDLDDAGVHACPCPCCGGRMLIIEVFAPGCEPSHRPTPIVIWIDTS